MRRARALAALLAFSGAAQAHGFGRLYNLPVPFWLYAWAAAAVLVVSFLLVAWFASRPAPQAAAAPRDLSGSALARGLRRWQPVLRGLALGLLLLCILTGFFGSRDPYRNFSMTFFWVWFVLGFAYLSALLGDFYAQLNPWRTLSAAIGRVWRGYTRGRFPYPAGLGDWPALGFYLAFIWFELFGLGRPLGLAQMLTAYTLLNLLGVWAVGSRAWFQHCEFFALFLRLLGRMAPLSLEQGRLQLRPPLAGLSAGAAPQISTVVFILAMLSTTAFDGLRATQTWVGLFWRDPTGLVRALSGDLPIHDIGRMRVWYIGWETFWLCASPFIYFALYWCAIDLARRLARSAVSTRELALAFAYPLLPIALVYSLTHYSTLLLTQGLKLVSLFSDPFGWGWNLFGGARLWRAPILPDMDWVWHSQVGLILFGHILGVYASHQVALRLFPTRSAALLSQLPLLALMLGFTVAGLWILAQPLTAMLPR